MCSAAGAEAALLPGSGSTISDTVRGIMEPPRGTGITRLEEGEGEEVMVLGMVSPARSGLTELTLPLLLSLDRVSVSTTSTTSS